MKFRSPVFVGILFLSVIGILTKIYLTQKLSNNFSWHFLPSAAWGMPQKMIDKGMSVFYPDPKTPGWDGQFYYYIANDLIAAEDTPRHLDSPAYRYQRIGLPMLAALMSKALLLDWVPPGLYFLVQITTVLAASILLGQIFLNLGQSVWFALIWVLSYGTLATPLFGLPDAFADSIFIIGLSMAFKKRTNIAICFFALAALSRENYIMIFPSMFFFYYLASRRKSEEKNQGTFIFLILGMVPWVLWQIWLRSHFEMSPTSQAKGVLGPPFGAIFKYLSAAAHRDHAVFGTGRVNYFEFFLISYFLVIVLSTVYWSIKSLRSSPDYLWKGLALFCLLNALMFLCFGPVVMKHHAGFLKAMSCLLVILPLLYFKMNSAVLSKQKRMIVFSAISVHVSIAMVLVLHQVMK